MSKAKITSEILPFISIIHHSKGRLRLDVNSKIKSLDLSNYSLDEIFDIKGVLDIKINKILGKITIIYDANLLDSTLLEKLINSRDENEISKILAELNIND